MKAGWWLATACAALLGACVTTGEDYKAPQLAVPASYVGTTPAAASADRELDGWWLAFGDPVLNQLVDLGLKGNPGLDLAAARIVEARAGRRQAQAGLGPSVNVGAGLTGRQSRVSGGRDDGTSEFSGSFQPGFDASWELDIFGGQRRAVEAAEAEEQQAVEDHRFAQVTLIAEIIRNYVDLRGAQRRLNLSERSLDLQRSTLDLVSRRAQAGLVSQLDLVRAQAAVSTLEAQLPPIEADIEDARNALAVLVGVPPGSLPVEIKFTGIIPMMEDAPAVGLPADLLRRRPDLRAAERNLAAATARIGVAEAAIYPSFRIPGSLGYAVSGLFTDEIVRTLTASIGAAISAPLYDGGLRTAEIDAAKARATQALASYRSALLDALQEVEAALTRYQSAQRRKQSLTAAVAADQKAVDQSQALYRQGLATFLDVLDAQRTLTTAQQQLAQADTDVSDQLVALYKALGGGPA